MNSKKRPVYYDDIIAVALVLLGIAATALIAVGFIVSTADHVEPAYVWQRTQKVLLVMTILATPTVIRILVEANKKIGEL